MKSIKWFKVWVVTIVFILSVPLLWSQAAFAELGDPLVGLSFEELTRFNEGKTEFTKTATVASGLGPVFNGRSCRGCHRGHITPVIGGGSTTRVTRFGTITDGVFDPLEQFGGSLIQVNAIGPPDSPHQFTPETVPASATIVALRRTQPLFGLGLVDAVPDNTFIRLAKRQAELDKGTAGRVNMVIDIATDSPAVGKFGWKSQVASLLDFSGEAFLNEMGITNPLFPDENPPGGDFSELAFNPVPGLNDDGTGVQKLTNFMTLLAPPPRGPIDTDIRAGDGFFNSIGCAACHVETLTTGPSSVDALNHKVFHPYSDFLLHDIGTGDGIVQEEASGNEIRTAPLWGLREINRFLHDSRATTIEEAIAAHGGQAAKAQDRFQKLSDTKKAKLMKFLLSL